ncbi:hypothetical protein JGK41_000782 [Pseudomonas putida]|nr:hypothetical protein [Pseudomonas putida]
MAVEHELHGFFRSYARKLAEDYQATRPRVLEDPGTSGDQGEASWANLLRDWLPEGYSVVTKGRILGASGDASPQVDVIVLKPNYPKFLKGQMYYLLDGVAAAFECKLTLKSEHIEKAFETSKIIASLQQKPTDSPQKQLMSPLVYGVLAHSYSWASDKDTVVANLTEKIHEAAERANEPRELPELFCVADLAGWRLSHCSHAHYIMGDWIEPNPTIRDEAINIILKKYPDIPHTLNRTERYVQAYIQKPHSEYSTQYYPKHIDSSSPTDSWERFTPIGAFISALYDKLAYRDHSLLNISKYFNDVHVPASSGGVNSASGRLQWPRTVLTEETWSGAWGSGPEWTNIYF